MQTPRDENRIATLLGVSNVDGVTPVVLWADPVTHRLLVDIPGGSNPLTTKGDIFTYTNTSARLPVGVDGTVLTADSTQATGLKWSSAGAGDMVLASIQTVTGAKTFGSAGAVDKLIIAGNTSGATILNAAAVAGSTTVTLPGATTTLVGIDTSDTLTNKTLTTPVINGLPTGTGVASVATVSTLASRDANGNSTFANIIEGFASTATAAGTTTLTVSSGYTQVFTGSTTQTVQLPTTGVVAGQSYTIINSSTGAVTVQSSGANTIVILAGGTFGMFTALVNTPTTAANWNYWYEGMVVASGKKVTSNNTLTFSGTDGTTMTFPPTSATLARTDAANTFTGVQTLSSSPVLSTGIVTVSGNSVTFPTTADTLVARATTDTLTNKRITAREVTTASSATPTPNGDTTDIYTITAQAAGATFGAPTGTPTQGQKLVIRIKDNASPQTLAWNAIYRASTDLALPTTTVTSKTLYCGFIYNSTDSKWDLIALLNNI